MADHTDALGRISATTSLEEIYPVLASLHATPGWHKKRPSLWREPRTEFTPRHWSYEVCRAAIDQAGQWISTELAERRNTLLFNPVGDNDYDTVRTLVAAYQMIKPGEYARAHRHSPNAMRLVLDAGPGCYTVVDGVELPMQSGDFLLTPGWCWHSHYNEEGAGANAYWIDFLDVPLVHLLEPMFFEEHPQGYQPVDSRAAEHDWYFPAARTGPQLAAQPEHGGLRRLVLDTQAHIPTVEISYLGLAPGRNVEFPADTASRILAVTQGQGVARVGDLDIAWKRGDVIAVPSWTGFSLSADGQGQMLEVSDKPVLEKLGLFRAQRR
ncbi:MAG: cupin domain-containing protein [Pigmentiphaga sp.]|uniref:cupin domain-containing protein n=1 Tax=Pigmentiphaga sp. TaxID=1977564 RepID=UPI0029BF032D|nr:cupin domain-containing protein [Pigmentiphaga sp.]MDX3907282.1 cupin domain-containing protein [Pigmentiphaga sp.]